MKQVRFCIIALCLFSTLAIAATPVYYVADELIVKLQKSVELQNGSDGVVTNNAWLQNVLNDAGVIGSEEIFPFDRSGTRLSRMFILTLQEGSDVIGACDELALVECVSLVTPNYRSPDSGQDHSVFSFNQWGIEKVEMPSAWGLFFGDRSVIIADVDTGVDHAHFDLNDNIWCNADEIPDNGIDDDSNGYVDDCVGWDFSAFPYRIDSADSGEIFWKAGDNDPGVDEFDPFGFHEHGTHVAGIIGAENRGGLLLNCLDVVGVAKSCQIMPVQCCNGNGIFVDTWLAEGLRYAVDNGAEVINMSWGADPDEPSGDFIYNALQYARARGVVLCAAAGNDDVSTPCYPASYDGIISVAALNSSDEKSSFSNYGEAVDISAPGSKIYSTLADNEYGYKNGTSMACPFVSGAAGLLLGYGQTLGFDFSSAQIEYFLKQGAYSIEAENPDYEGSLGAGGLNVYNSMLLAQNPPRMIKAIEVRSPAEVSAMAEQSYCDFQAIAIYSDDTTEDVTDQVYWQVYPFRYGCFSEQVAGRFYSFSVVADREVFISATLYGASGELFAQHVMVIEDDDEASPVTIIGVDAIVADSSARYKAAYQKNDGEVVDVTGDVVWEVLQGGEFANFDASEAGRLLIAESSVGEIVQIKATYNDIASGNTFEQTKTNIAVTSDYQVSALALIGPVLLTPGAPAQFTARLILENEQSPIDVTMFSDWSISPSIAGCFPDPAGQSGLFICDNVEEETAVTLRVIYQVGDEELTAELSAIITPSLSHDPDIAAGEETSSLLDLLSRFSCSLPATFILTSLLGCLLLIKD